MVLRRIEPSPNDLSQSSSQQNRPEAIQGQLASLTATLRDVQDKVSQTPTDSKSITGPPPSEASHQDSYQDSYHDEDPEVVESYRDVPQHAPPVYTAEPPAYDPSIDYNHPTHPPPHPTPLIPRPSHLPSPDPSRSLRRHETAQSITGTYNLRDRIDFSTTSGSISISVELSDEDILNPRSTQTPTLQLSTRSGSINLIFKTPRFSNLPLNHTTILTTVSGSCNARIVHGLSTSVSTSSGSQSLDIYPSALGNESYLTTSSKSGSQSISVHDPDGAAGAKLDHFRADITTLGSASLHVRYPRTWEGTVHAASGGSGNVNVLGRNIDVVGLGPREAHGTRGKGSRTELFGSGSGSINFYAS